MYCNPIATYTWHFIGSFNGKALLQQPMYVCMYVFYDMQLEVLQLKAICVFRQMQF